MMRSIAIVAASFAATFIVVRIYRAIKRRK